MKTKLISFLLLSIIHTVLPQIIKNNFIKVIVPEKDSIISYYNGYRLSAWTLPNSKVYVNDVEYKVYSTGAFAGLLELKPGFNNFIIKSISKEGEIVEKDLFIEYKPKEVFQPPKELKIVSIEKPTSNIMAQVGDILEFEIKATSNCEITINDKIFLKEVEHSGIYRSLYKVVEGDFVNGELKVQIKNSNGEKLIQIAKQKIQVLKSYLIGKVKIKNPWDRPSIAVSLGTDRLGGQKYQYIVPDVKLVIIGKNSNMYKVKLGDNIGWIDEDYIEILENYKFPYSLTSSIKVAGGIKYDSIVVPLTEKLPYISYQDPELNRIVIDVYNCSGNTNWITQYSNVKEIKNIFINQVSPETFRINIDLNGQMNYGYAIDYKGNSLIIKIKHKPTDLKLKNKIIVLDAGHGGSDNGAIGASGNFEKEINLKMVYILKKLFEKKGAIVYLTRDKDTLLYNNHRLWQIWNYNPDIFISIHCNSIGYYTNPMEVKGISTYYKHIIFRPLSKYILNNCLKLKLDEFGNVGNFNFTNNQPTEFVNTLVELAFISNPEDEIKLLDNNFLNKLANQIVKGTEEYFKNLR